MKIEEAERLLREAKHDPGCNADEPGGECCSGCGYVTASATIQNMAADSLRVASKLAQALEKRSFQSHSLSAMGGTLTGGGSPRPHQSYGWRKCPDEPCPSDRRALAAWEAL
jgi:hypothetical protein